MNRKFCQNDQKHDLFNVSYFRFIANILAAVFLASDSPLFTPYLYPQIFVDFNYAKRSPPRFHQCRELIHSSIKPALLALTAVNFFDESMQQAATEMVELVLADLIEEINSKREIDNKTKDILTEKLETAKLWVMFPDEILNVTGINELYDEIDFDGSESLAELTVKINIHNAKLQIDQKHDQTKQFLSIINIEGLGVYDLDLNIICKHD